MYPDFKRTALLQSLYDRVTVREDILLYGQAGNGKTHLLKQLQKRLLQRRICFYFSFRGIRAFDAFTTYYQEVLQTEARNHPTVDYHLKQFFQQNPVIQLRNWTQWLNWHQHLTGTLGQLSQDLLFVIDHFEEWEVSGKSHFPDEALPQIRELRNCQWLIATQQETIFDGFSVMEVPPLTIKEVEESTLPVESLQEYHSYTKGNVAFLTELLAHEGNLEPQIKALMEQRHRHFLFFKARFTSLQWNLLRALALEENVQQPLAFSFLVKYKLGAASSVDRALTNLLSSRMILKSQEEGYILRDVALLRWFQWLYVAEEAP